MNYLWGDYPEWPGGGGGGMLLLLFIFSFLCFFLWIIVCLYCILDTFCLSLQFVYQVLVSSVFQYEEQQTNFVNHENRRLWIPHFQKCLLFLFLFFYKRDNSTKIWFIAFPSFHFILFYFMTPVLFPYLANNRNKNILVWMASYIPDFDEGFCNPPWLYNEQQNK